MSSELTPLQKLINVSNATDFRQLPPQVATLINTQGDKSLEYIKTELENLNNKSIIKSQIIELINERLKSIAYSKQPKKGWFSRGGKSRRRRRPRRNRKSRKNSWWF